MIVTEGTLSSSDTAVLMIDATAASVETAITDDDVPVASISGPATVGEDAGALTGAQPGGTGSTVRLDRAVDVAWPQSTVSFITRQSSR